MNQTLHTGDCLTWVKEISDNSIALLFTSPPYLSARSYGRTDVARDLDEWVAWMMDVVKAFAPKVTGLMAINCEGQTRGYKYQPAPFLLMADLHRAGFNLRKPCVYERDGVPGSGQLDWLKNRWEPIICITRPGRLPWSDATACGHPPKCQAGGRVSHRNTDGTRQRFGVATRTRSGDGEREIPIDRARGRAVPEIANPGNVIDCGANTHFGLGNQSEAPFPMKLADFFVKSFCQPGGLVCDPFCGSGTVCESAITHGRRFVGGDIRPCQISLTRRRMLGVTPQMQPAEETL